MRGIDEYMRGTGRLLRAGRGEDLGPRPAHGRQQHLHLLPRPPRQHRRVHHRAGELDEDTWHPHLYDFSEPEVTDQWGTANPMNEFVAKQSFNDPDRGVFVAPPV